MKVMLDTNICIHLIRQKPVQVLEKLQHYNLGDVGVSTITVAELQYGAAKSQRQQQNQNALTQFLAPLEIVDFDADAALKYGQIRAELERLGTPVGANDLLIASHALGLGVVLVTNNGREFSRIPALIIENWVD